MKPKPLTLLFGMFCGLWTVAVADAPDAREKLHIRTTPAGYDSIVASWKANAVSETFDNYARDFIGLDTSRFLPGSLDRHGNGLPSAAQDDRLADPSSVQRNRSQTDRRLHDDPQGAYAAHADLLPVLFPDLRTGIGEKRTAAGTQIPARNRIGAATDRYIAGRVP